MTIKYSLFESADRRAGPRVLIFGAVHGNEPCGPVAIARVSEKIKSKKIVITRGSVCFVPVCNERSYESKKRYLEADLNRVFRETESPKTYEADLANKLCMFMKNADVFLDMHSTTAHGPTSVFVDYPTKENTALAESLGVEYAILDWQKLYAENEYSFVSYDTIRYTHDIGITGVIVECGQHDDPKTIDVAERVILRALAHVGVIESTDVEPLVPMLKVRMTRLEKRLATGDRFEKEWKHLEQISAGTRIATRESGKILTAEKDCLILLPKSHAKPDEEWYYLGVRES